MRPIYEIKTQNISGAQDAEVASSSVVKESAPDHFARESRAKPTLSNAVPRFHGSSQIWWRELQPLIDALPTKLPEIGLELSEMNKEALRELARAAPHRETVNN